MPNSHFTTRGKIAFCLTVFFCLFLTEFSNARAEGYQLSQNLAANQFFSGYRLSPDGKFAVYKITSFDENFNESVQLFSVDTATRTRRAITPMIGGDGKFFGEYQITPDSQNVVYNASLEANAFFRSELYSIPIAATNQNQRRNIGNVPANSTADVFEFYISPNSQHVVYEQFEENAAYENFNILFRVAPTGGTVTQLTPRTPDGEAEEAVFAPDSSRIVYQFSSPATDGNRIYQSVSITGTGRKTVAENVSGGAEPSITSDSQRFVFTAADSSSGETRLYSTTLTGSGTRRQLSRNGEEVYNFRFANDYPVIVYAFKPTSDPGFSPTSFGFAAADDSYEAVSYNTGKELDTFNFAVTPNNAAVIYIASSGGAPQLYSLTYQNNAGFEQQLSIAPASAPTSGGPFTGVNDFKIAPNSQRVVFRATQGNAFSPDLFSVAISNNPLAVKLNNLAAENGANGSDFGVGSYFITPNSARVIFGYSPTDGSCCGNDLYTNQITGGTPTGPFATKANDDVFSDTPKITPDARRVVYTKTVFDDFGNPITTVWAANVP